MAHLLHIDSSALSVGSVSKETAATFRMAWHEVRPASEVTYRDLGSEAVPALTDASLLAFTVGPDSRTKKQTAAFEVRMALVQEVIVADEYLFSVPIYNWGIPAPFKAWLDQVILPGYTLSTTDQAPLAGRPATLILTCGGDPRSVKESWDLVQPYLEKVLGQALGLDLTIIKAQLTVAEMTPDMAELIPVAWEQRTAAHAAARTQAQRAAIDVAATTWPQRERL
jgi:FMN-dependent NADH-azoreductase